MVRHVFGVGDESWTVRLPGLGPGGGRGSVQKLSGGHPGMAWHGLVSVSVTNLRRSGCQGLAQAGSGLGPAQRQGIQKVRRSRRHGSARFWCR